ncbi:MAG: hypothetical protein CMP45_02995 [Rickettsiales bacterium]|nr:hypothetical protein [Verrucomicrobiaceae bacterium]MBV63460.1 hypothetical protein [Rickettsiales bacterium]|tara:strand:+ start:6373 stop:7341 length:969 start_codon:yes stop_codon:yes gene_type:complete
MRLNLIILSILFVLHYNGGAQEIDYKKQIAPILASKCNSCHTAKKKESDKKPKAGLALDTPLGIRSGGVLEVGDALSSELYVRVSLPKNAEDLMPPVDDGGPLSSREIELIKKWIDDGARFSSSDAEGLSKLDDSLDARKVLGMPVREPNVDAISHLEGIGATITPVSVALPEYLSIEWISTYHKITDKEIEQTLHLAPNIVELDLSRTKLTNEGLKHVGKLGRLTHLNLSRTGIDDNGIKALSELKSLEWLNLYGTKITDASIPIIAKYRDLKAVYLWGSSVSDEGASSLRKSLPDAKVVRDTDARANRFNDLDEPNRFDF